MKIAGIVFIITSAFSAGMRLARGLRQRCAYLRHLLNALELLQNEISFSATPLPEAFGLMAGVMQGTGKEIVSFVSEQMLKDRWTTPHSAMERALSKFPDDLIGEILLELSSKLGKYDIEVQLSGIEQARSRVRELMCVMERDLRVKSKTYQTICICAGLAMAILLI